MTRLAWNNIGEVDLATWRWPNFSPAELASNGDGSLVVMTEALDRLQELRTLMARPLTINSAYRDPIYNAKVGGAPLSRHKVGDAYDISILGLDKWRLEELARQVGFQGFGYYNTFLHVDMGGSRSWRSW